MKLKTDVIPENTPPPPTHRWEGVIFWQDPQHFWEFQSSFILSLKFEAFELALLPKSPGIYNTFHVGGGGGTGVWILSGTAP